MTTRTYGLSGSGMDVDQMVKDLMKARRASYDKLVQKKTQLEWKKADYNTMYTTVKDFRNTVFNNKLQSTLMPKISTSSNESVISATSNSDAANVTHSITVAQLADGVKKSSNAAITATGNAKNTLANQFGMSADVNITIKNGDKSAKVTIKPGESIYDVVSNINKAGVNVTANYDATLDRFFLYTTDTGASSSISFDGTDANGLAFLNSNLKLNTATETGKDAEFSLDGVGTGILGDTDNLKMSTNSFTISGVTYDLKATGTASVRVAADTEKAVANVKAFIESYNSTLEKINAELNETRYKSYLPLTADQKKDMKDTEIAEWEKMAKSGTLRQDPVLRELVAQMRSDLSAPISSVTGKYNSAASLGITTGSYTEGGKLYLTESKLREALEADPNVLSKIFSTDGDGSSTDGIAVRLYDTLKKGMDKVTNEAGFSAGVSDDTKSNLAKRIAGYDTEMEALNDRLAQIEERYYKQFDAMETALSKLNQQSSWLAQQFSQ